MNINKFLDYILLKLVKRRWRRLYKQLVKKEIQSQQYAKRRRYYESMMWEIKLNKV